MYWQRGNAMTFSKPAGRYDAEMAAQLLSIGDMEQRNNGDQADVKAFQLDKL